MPVPDHVEDRISGEALSAFLATAVDDRPHVAPVWYLYESERLWFFTSGKKLQNIQQNPHIAVAIEQSGEDSWVALFRGTATTVRDSDRRSDIADRLFATYLGDSEAETFRDESDQPTGTLVRVDIGSVNFRTQ